MIKLPPEYAALPEDAVYARIRRHKEALGDALAILGHHYQTNEVIQFADYRGDSLELSRRAATLERARYIVFCGVHFMAETAAMLCQPEQIVVQPVIEALCPMACMASLDEVTEAWEALASVWGDDMLPITYQNSTAEIKAFVGRHDGAVCTSSNADRLLRWAWERKRHVLFLPDEHLGTNTALAMGVPREQIGAWEPIMPPEPLALAECRLVAWKGYCYVHADMTAADVDVARAQYPDARVVVHPECPQEVMAKADAYGSTTRIIRYVQEAPAGAVIVVGTEWHLVNRLAQEHPDKTVVPLSARGCQAMGMTTARHLLLVLDDIARGAPSGVVTVDADTAQWARLALERMLKVS
ncbi:MAG: quinolinate synthase NadA [Chloroflexota bacterium]